MDIVGHILEECIPLLDGDEKGRLLEHLVAIIDRELTAAPTDIRDGCCPRCRSQAIVKKGRAGGRQRWLCRDCKKTFCASTSRILALSKLPGQTWAAYVRCMVEGRTLRECATECKVGLKTSFFMRIRVCECMAGYLEPFTVGAGCTAEIDEYNIRESLKGNHRKGNGAKMPRTPKRRPSDGATAGSSMGLIVVLTGVNDRGAVFAEICARGRMDADEARGVLKGKVEEGSIISTDWNTTYVRLLAKLNVAVHNRYVSTNRREGVINAVNSLHARIEGFLGRFRGVSSRRLHHYLAWFKWAESYKALHIARERGELAVAQVVSGTYQTRLRQCWKAPYPFGEYWGLPC